MSLVPSLLQAIVHVDGEALVMHAGDKPYVVSPTGQVDLATRGLALDAVNGIVNQLLPPELQRALDEFGAVQHELPPIPEFPGEMFTIVAARGGDDVWVEIRRRRTTDDDRVPEEFFTTPDGAASVQPYPVYASAASPSLSQSAEPLPDSLDVSGVGYGKERAPHSAAPAPREAPAAGPIPPEVQFGSPFSPAAPLAALNARQTAAEEAIEINLDFDVREAPSLASAFESQAAIEKKIEDAVTAAGVAPPSLPVAPPPAIVPSPVVAPSRPVVTQPPTVTMPAHALVPPPVVPPPLAPPVAASPAAPVVAPPVVAPPVVAPPVVASPVVASSAVASPVVPSPVAPPPSLTPVAPSPRPLSAPPVATAPPAVATARVPPPLPERIPAPPVEVSATQPAVVLPLARNPIRAEQPPPAVGDPTMSGLDRLLRLSAARGASTMYLSSDSKPGVRVDGELQTLEGEPVLTARDVESLLLTLMPERNHEALRTGAATEWILDIEDVGRVRCMSFRDHRGPGGVFRLMPTRSVSVDQLGLPRAVQDLAIEPEGLVLVAGPRSSGKRTLMSAFVDLINRTRRDHVITIEREINIVHERGSSFVSQREVRGSDEEVLAAARAALREDPDVLVIEDLRTAGLVNVALEASASGHLVVGGFSAHTATGTVDRIIDLYAPDSRRQVQFALADSLRGVVVQVLLKKNGGGRVAAREVLLNTPAVSSVIAEGKTSQLPMAIEGGRRWGMMPLNDALVGLVQQGTVDGREAYRYASDRQGLLAALKHQGVDTSFVERLA
ncbi:MAG TPA: ATPase, T2SS/T4P/T4SS family [Vicinamibacterales bacterium]|nr:ATPase, T2SS/T4P/T4SS family [Vicinamibacterales bacterium]